MNVLMTGSAGFLGQGMVKAFEETDHHLRMFDVVESPGKGESIVGSVEDLEFVRNAVKGMDAVVIGHMAPRKIGDRDVYADPIMPYDVNVKGTANLFFAAVEEGIKHICLISSGGAVQFAQNDNQYLTDKLPYGGPGQYSHTKAIQEFIAELYLKQYPDLSIGILRPAYINDAETQTDKYGRRWKEVNYQYIDRTDIGRAAIAVIEMDDLKAEKFYVLGMDYALGRADVDRTKSRLNWQPRYTYEGCKRDKN